MDNIELLQQAVMQAADIKAPPGGGRGWQFGYEFLFNPRIRCPWCSEWVPSKRVWLVDEGEGVVKKVWDLAGHPIRVGYCHPHVGSGGEVCQGTAETAVQAIVAGVSPGGEFGEVKAHKWFPEVLGHECPSMGEEDDHDGEVYCEACGEWFPEDDTRWSEDNEATYCDDCYADRHSTCDDCGTSVYTGLYGGQGDMRSVGYRKVCSGCYEDNYFYCEGCEEDFHTREHAGYLDDESLCKECWTERHDGCEACGEEFLKDELEDGLCEECVAERERDSDPEAPYYVPLAEELEAVGQLRLEVGNDA